MRARMRPTAAISTLLLALTLAATPVAACQPGSPPESDRSDDQPPATTPPAEAPSEVSTLSAAIENTELDRADRLGAATALVARGSSRDGLLAINAILGRGVGEGSGARLLLEAMARTPVAPRELWAPVSLVPGDDAAVRRFVASAAGSFRTRQAAEMLVGLLRDDPDAGVRRAAHTALVRLSGRDLPADAGAWESWLQRQGAVDGIAWLGGLIEGLADRADRLEQRARVAENHLTDAYRRLHLALEPEARSGLLVTMLHEQIPSVRTLAFDLIDRELASALRLGPEVGEATVDLMDDADASIRRRAAALVVRLGPESGAGAILERLRAERDPAVAAALLRGVTRWPSAEAAPFVARWAGERGPARDVALEAAWSLHRAGALGEGEPRDQLLSILREREAGLLTVQGLRLLAALGEERDLARVRDLLSGDDAEARARAAGALASDPGSIDAIVAAAHSDPALFGAARRALLTRGATADALLTLRGLPAPSPEARRDAVLEMCEAMPAPELVRAAAGLDDDGLAERVLARLEEDTPADGSPAGGAIGEAMVLLGAARLRMGRADEALATLERATVAPENTTLLAAWVGARVSCLLGLGRVEDAMGLEAGADAWLRGLELAVGTPHARWVHDELTVRFAGALDEAQRARLAELRTRLGDAAPETDPAP